MPSWDGNKLVLVATPADGKGKVVTVIREIIDDQMVQVIYLSSVINNQKLTDE